MRSPKLRQQGDIGRHSHVEAPSDNGLSGHHGHVRSGMASTGNPVDQCTLLRLANEGGLPLVAAAVPKSSCQGDVSALSTKAALPRRPV